MRSENPSKNHVFILGAKRTPIGAFLGGLKDIPAPKLGAQALTAAVSEAGIDPSQIEECIMGCVLPAGIGQAPARQASIFAGFPKSVRATTINRVCGSGLKAVMLADQMIRAGDSAVVAAGGMENMSQVPYLLTKAREGYRLGNGKLIDSMVHDGLWDVYGDTHMGNCAELCSRERKISREDQDAFAKASYQRAVAAIEGGLFKKETVAITVKTRTETLTIERDEEPFRAKLDKFSTLKPSFDPAGTVTAANASSLSDGASALVIASADATQRFGARPIARIVAQASFAQEPEWFTTAPVGAIRRLLEKANMGIKDIGLFEINEAFSVVALACMRELDLSAEKVNIRGGAVALGHPIGASGARILTTLVHAMHAEKQQFGVAAICIGGGEASAVLVEAM